MAESNTIPLIAVVGPTASGKTSLAVDICEKIGGVMQPYSKCRRFKYDPLKREPKVITLNRDFKKEDFSL